MSAYAEIPQPAFEEEHSSFSNGEVFEQPPADTLALVPPIEPVISKEVRADLRFEDDPEIPKKILKNAKLFFGKPKSEVFDQIIATRDTRLMGMKMVLNKYPQYEHVTKLSHDKFINSKNRLQKQIEINGKRLQLSKAIGQATLDAIINDVYRQKVEINDPLAQTIEILKTHEQSIRPHDMNQLITDSVVVFAGREVSKNTSREVARIKTIGATAINN